MVEGEESAGVGGLGRKDLPPFFLGEINKVKIDGFYQKYDVKPGIVKNTPV